MSRQVINTTQAPAAIGPYVQAIDLGQLVFASGQIPLVPATGQIISDDVEEQTRQALENAMAILKSAGLTAADIVKTTVFIIDMNDFTMINREYERFFNDHNAPFPARSCVEVSRLPKEAKIEIEVIAARR